MSNGDMMHIAHRARLAPPSIPRPSIQASHAAGPTPQDHTGMVAVVQYTETRLHVLRDCSVKCIWSFPTHVAAWCRVPGLNNSAGREENDISKDRLFVCTADCRLWLIPLMHADLFLKNKQEQHRQHHDHQGAESQPEAASASSPSSFSSSSQRRPAPPVPASAPRRSPPKGDKGNIPPSVTVINLDSDDDEEEELELWNDEDDLLQSQPILEKRSLTSKSPPLKRHRAASSSSSSSAVVIAKDTIVESATASGQYQAAVAEMTTMAIPMTVAVEESQYLVCKVDHEDEEMDGSVVKVFYVPYAGGVLILFQDGRIGFYKPEDQGEWRLRPPTSPQPLDIWGNVGNDRPISGCSTGNIVFVGTQAGGVHAFVLHDSGALAKKGLIVHQMGQPVQEILIVQENGESIVPESDLLVATGAVALFGRHGKIKMARWYHHQKDNEVELVQSFETKLPTNTLLRSACYQGGHCLVLTEQHEVLACQVRADQDNKTENAPVFWVLSQRWLHLKVPPLTAIASLVATTAEWLGLSLSGHLLFYDQGITRLSVPLEIYQTRQEIWTKLQQMDIASHAIQTLEQKGQIADQGIARLNRIIHTLQRAVAASNQHQGEEMEGAGNELIHIDISTIVFPSSMTRVVGKKYFLRLKISSNLRMDWSEGWALIWQFGPMRTTCTTCQPSPSSSSASSKNTTGLAVGSSIPLTGLALGRMLQRDVEVDLDQLVLPLHVTLGLEYRLPGSSLGGHVVYFPVDLIPLDLLHFAEPVVFDAPVPTTATTLLDARQEGTGAIPLQYTRDMPSPPQCQCTSIGAAILDTVDHDIYRWIERSDNRIYFLLDPPSLSDGGGGGGAAESVSICFDNCLSILLGEYIATSTDQQHRLAGILISPETAYLSIPSCSATAPFRLPCRGGLSVSAEYPRWPCTTARIRLELPEDDAGGRERVQRWRAGAATGTGVGRSIDDRLQACLVVSETADSATTLQLMDALERRIRELIMP